jgi:germination protein M
MNRRMFLISVAACIAVVLIVTAVLFLERGAPEDRAEAPAGGASSDAAASGAPAPGALPPGAAGTAESAGAEPATAVPGLTEPGTAEPATPASAAAGTGTEAADAAATDAITSDKNRREVVLFFQTRDSEYLGPERRKIFLTPSPVDQAKQIVVELINGPNRRDLLPTVPKETRLRGLYLDRAGTAYVDLSVEVAARHPGGTSEEIATLFSLVNSLTYNLPEIKRVHILVEGEERDTLVHLDLRRDYRQDLSIVDMERGQG